MRKRPVIVARPWETSLKLSRTLHSSALRSTWTARWGPADDLPIYREEPTCVRDAHPIGGLHVGSRPKCEVRERPPLRCLWGVGGHQSWCRTIAIYEYTPSVMGPVMSSLPEALAAGRPCLQPVTSFEFSIGTKWLEALKQTAPHVEDGLQELGWVKGRARMRQVRHKPLADRGGHLREHDRHGSALLPERGSHRRAVG